MSNKKMIAFVSAAALAACLALAGCGGGQAASSASAAASEASAAASASAAAESAAASAEAAAASAEAAAASAEAAAASAASEVASAAADAVDSYIGDAAAIDVALGEAGFGTGDVTDLEAELDLDDAVPHYEVSFKQGGMEYDYDIDAVTGEVISAESDVDD